MLTAEERILEETYNDMALLSSSKYKIKMTLGTNPTVMYPIVFSIDTEAALNLITAAFIEP